MPKVTQDSQRVHVLSGAFDGRAEFRELLKEQRRALKGSFSFKNVMFRRQIRMVLRNDAAFEKVYADAIGQSATALIESNRVNEFGDGEFGKWFLEWLGNGGWEIILQIIKDLMKFF